MHRLEHRIYAGAPGEKVSVDTDVEGGGAVTVFIDGAEAEEDPTFNLKTTVGTETRMQISLIGAEGESCVVHISDVDGGSDTDLLLCQKLDPAPIHEYRFIVAPATAIASLARGRAESATRPGTGLRASPKTSSPRTTRRKKASTKKARGKK